MSLYDDDDLGTKPPAWSSGIKLMPTVKRPQPPTTKKVSTVLTPVINLTTNKKEDLKSLIKPKVVISNKPIIPVPALPTLQSAVKDYSWEIEDEYDPSFPNDYDKIMKERREKIEENRRRDRERKRKGSPSQNKNFNKAASDDEDEYNKYAKLGAAGQKAAIAPPPSLQENTPSDSSYGASGSVAEKIMAKYGWQGQGLGKQEQGMSIALQVEKTSKRGGRIIHEKELKEKELMPPPILGGPATPSTAIPGSVTPLQGTAEQREQSITEIIKSPSKVVLLRNMVGPGDVDEELEPEVKDECNGKYGEVSRVIIHEVHGVVSEEAVRIFVEFKRIESAIKAVVDLNGRFFGGRQVKAGFYSHKKFESLQLLD